MHCVNGVQFGSEGSRHQCGFRCRHCEIPGIFISPRSAASASHLGTLTCTQPSLTYILAVFKSVQRGGTKNWTTNLVDACPEAQNLPFLGTKGGLVFLGNSTSVGGHGEMDKVIEP
jgi:hypothetical protein